MDYSISKENTEILEHRFMKVENGTAILLDGEQVERELAVEYGITL
jgi:hypothetical protein